MIVNSKILRKKRLEKYSFNIFVNNGVTVEGIQYLLTVEKFMKTKHLPFNPGATLNRQKMRNRKLLRHQPIPSSPLPR